MIFDLETKKFLKSLSEPQAIPNPEWFRFDVKLLSIILVRTNAEGLPPTVELDEKVVQIGIGDPTSTPATTATNTDFIEATGEYYFSLRLDVAGITTLLNGSRQVTTTFEVFAVTNDSSDHYQTDVSIREPLIDGTIADPAPPEVGITLSQARAMFVEKNGVTYIKFKKPNGKFILLSFGNNDQPLYRPVQI